MHWTFDICMHWTFDVCIEMDQRPASGIARAGFERRDPAAAIRLHDIETRSSSILEA